LGNLAFSGDQFIKILHKLMLSADIVPIPKGFHIDARLITVGTADIDAVHLQREIEWEDGEDVERTILGSIFGIYY
jgi:hypothetical protein